MDDVRSTFHSNIVQMIAMAKFSVPHMKMGGRCVLVSLSVIDVC